MTNKITQQLNQKLIAINHLLLPYKKETLVVSVSGGIDSMVLLNFLKQHEYKIVVVFFNHHMRSQAIIEQDLVYNTCKEYNYPCKVFDINYKGNGNFQSFARNKRHTYLKEVATKYKTKYILTAHHKSDQVENILYALNHGKNLHKPYLMQGILQHDKYTFIKPFLSLTKDEIKILSKNWNVKYLDDSSNFDIKYARNKLRNAVIPILIQDNPNFEHSLTNFITCYDYLLSFYQKQLVKKYNKIVSNNILDLKLFNQEDTYTKKSLLVMYLLKHNLRIKQKQISSILSLCDKDKNTTLLLTYNILLVISYHKLYLTNINNHSTLKLEEYKGQNIKKDTVYYSHKEILLTDGDSGTITYKKGDVKFPLEIRHIKDGDILLFNFGHKKLSRVLIDRKIPIDTRKSLIVITDSHNQILWIPSRVYLNTCLKGENKLYFYYPNQE